MILDPEFLAGSVDPHIGVGAVAVHVAPTTRQAALAHHIGHLMGGFGYAGPEVTLNVIVAQPRIRQALLAEDEMRELYGVAYEKYGGVIADQVVFAFVGIKLQGKTKHVTPAVG